MARTPPERRRVLIIGAGPTGMSVAFHLGEHSLLLERRHSLEDHDDHSYDFPMGAARGRDLGGEDAGADRHGLAAHEDSALFITRSSRTHAESERSLIQVDRWRPPDLAPPSQPGELRPPPSVRTLLPLLRGELRLGAHVVRVFPAARLVELAGGHRFVYDKLVSTLSLTAIEILVRHDLPPHVRGDEYFRYWLGEHDIEVADRAIQDCYGDLDEFATGKRFANRVGQALAEKFGNAARSKQRGVRLFTPRLVKAPTP